MRTIGLVRAALAALWLAHASVAAMPPDCVPGPTPAAAAGASPAGAAEPATPLVREPVPAQAAWVQRLQRDLARIDQAGGARIGVVVRDLDTGESAVHGTEQAWYLASAVKVPVAMAVLRAVQRGEVSLGTLLTLRAGDLVDGAGGTNRHRPGTALSVRYLLEQMIVHSDNTASDMLIGLVGVQAVHALVRALVPEGFGPITSLADVRRHVYAQLTPAALGLSGRDFLALREQPSDCARVLTLSNLLDVPVGRLAPLRLDTAYAAYYASGRNSARLESYADLLQALAQGQALDAVHTALLLAVMERVQTGEARIKAGLPEGVRFAHKTGTQRERSCDAGVLSVPRADAAPQRVVVVACTRGEPVAARSDRVLRQIGAAICRSGLITSGASRAPSCPVVPRLPSGPAAVPGLGDAGR